MRGDNGVGGAEREVVVRVHAALRFGLQNAVISLEPVAHAVHIERPAAIGHIDALRAIAFHQQRLACELFRRNHMAHHEEAGDVHAEIAGNADMLFGDVGFGAVRRHADRSDAKIIGAPQFFHRADAGQDQRGQNGFGEDVGNGLEPFPIGVCAKTIVEAGTGQTIAVRHFDGIHARIVESLGNRADMVDPVHVLDGVHAVTQGHVLNVDLVAGFNVKCAGHAAILLAASNSPVALAAAVIMSRLPE